ncbi:RHS repeat domain-containing protein [Paenibacillus sp. VTT E-133280]|uniref:RHS repeat domain-containing protein n=1 Tax=Paenibacillus sp. VTT E-133280 TaxID=1986222 RepID=UPI0015C60C77|nr:RHS repeat protein [Paenibacillus sp. VTT E-133280]
MMKKLRGFTAILLCISLCLGIFTDALIQTAQAASTESESEIDYDIKDTEYEPLSILDLVDQFQTSEVFVQQQLDEGLSLNDIYHIFYQANKKQISYDESRFLLFPKEVNTSASVTTEVYSELPSSMIRDINVMEAESVSQNVYMFTPTEFDSLTGEPIFPNKGEDISQSSVTEEVYNTSDIMRFSLSPGDTPVIEKPPVYNKSSFNEAPYSVGINDESVSTLSGGLSLQNTDFTLPGRNGLSFSLNRQYNTADSQFYESDYGYSTFDYDTYEWIVDYNGIKKSVLNKYYVNINETVEVEYDNNSDGSINSRGNLPQQTRKEGPYDTEEEARNRANLLLNTTYTTPSDTITGRSSIESRSPSFNYSIDYSSNGYAGTLYRTGASTIISGEAPQTKYINKTDTCQNNIPGLYTKGVWKATGTGTPCPSSIPYDVNGYKGTLTRTAVTDPLKECPSPTSTATNGVCTKQYLAHYSGTPSMTTEDTRYYRQEYSGPITKPGFTSASRYDSWSSMGNDRSRNVYTRFGAIYLTPITVESGGTPIQLYDGLFKSYTDAEAHKNWINNNAGTRVSTQTDTNGVTYNYYISSSPGASTKAVMTGTAQGVEYYNDINQPLYEKLYPIGKGWSWSLPFIETKDNKTYVHIAGGGRYEVEGNKLKGDDWEGTTFNSDSSVHLNGETSQYVMTSPDGQRRQYFSNDGLLLQISDPYENTIQFLYENNSYYGRKLLRQVKDPIGNTIDITYSATEVTLSKGNQKVVYKKHTQDGKELLDSVTDTQGRKTTYSYLIKNAQFNLFNSYPERARSNPYALLSEIQHPTGAATKYVYEPQPVKRYIGTDSFNEAYRIFSRADNVTYDNNGSAEYNRHTFFYNNTDLGSSYNQDFKFSTTLNNGLTETTYSYKKDYIDDQISARFYLESIVESADSVNKITSYSYNKYVNGRSYPALVPTIISLTNNQNGDLLSSNRSYDDFGNIIATTDDKGQTSTFTYDSINHLLKTALEPINSGKYQYTDYTRNAKGSISQITVRKDNTLGEILKQTSFEGYDIYGNPTVQKISNNGKTITTTTEYGAKGIYAFPTLQSVNVTNYKGEINQTLNATEYDITTGLITAFTDGKNLRTEYKYDNLGRILTVTHPDKSILEAAYDDVNNTSTVTDETGLKSRTQWNAMGMQTETSIYDDGRYKATAKSEYDKFGRVVVNEDAIGNKTINRFDAWGRLKATVSQDMSEVVNVYNDVSHIVTTTDAEGYSTLKTYDKWGRLERKEEKLHINDSYKTTLERFVYDTRDMVTEHYDGEGYGTLYNYDYSGNLISVTNAMGEVTQYGYDMLGNQIKTIFADGSTITKEYDELGTVIRSIDELGRNETYSYDKNGNLTTYTDRNGNMTVNSYDSMNRLTEKSNDNETVSFTYDTAGRRTKMTDNTGATDYNYNPNTGMLSSMKYPDGLDLEITEYNANGNRKQMINPFGVVTYYSYDTLNQLKNVGTSPVTPTASYNYYNNGLIKETITDGGIIGSYKHIGMDLSTLKYNNAGDTLEYYYRYDRNKNITSWSQNGIGEQLKYDRLNRISTSKGSNNESYGYDNRGNRQSMKSYDPESIQEYEYEYDKQNRLVQAKINGKTVKYGYNGDGLLVNRTEDGVITRYYYDGDQIIAEAKVVNGTPQLVASYIRGNRLEAIQYPDGSKAYPVYNGHGDIVELRNGQGALLNSYTYDMWGKITSKKEEVHNPFRYSGELWDDTTNLQYLRARWYDPSLGRFINEDTYEGQINNPLSLNLYTYVENNPQRYFDPTGHRKTESYYEIEMMLKASMNGDHHYQSNLKNLFSNVYSDNGNQFKYLYGLVTQTSAYSNSMGKASWAKGQLLNSLEASQDAFDSKVELMSFAGSLFLGGGNNSASIGFRNGQKLLPYIKHSAFSAVRDKWNQDAAYEFVKAMQKGIVGPEGQSGIKILSKGFSKNGIDYTHEVKVFTKELSNYRIFGYQDKGTGQYIFDYFAKGLHK